MRTKAIATAMFILSTLMLGCRATSQPTPAPPTPPPTSTSAPTATPIPSPTLTPASHAPPASDDSGAVVFYSDRDGDPEIYLMQADSKQVARLTHDPGFDDSPALSPDGMQIAFLTSRHDPNPRFPDLAYELYVMNADGGNMRRLTATEAAEDHPAWSPDGTRIVFDADYDGDGYYEIYTLALDGADEVRLTSNPANDQFADWSPDGTRIAFASDRDGNWDIYVMDVDGSNQHPLTAGPDWELFPAWSPDGSLIAYNALQPNSRNTDIYVMNADGSNVRTLTDTPGFDENPTWSLDGTRIAFQTARDGNFELYTMYSDGSDQRRLAVHLADDLWPSWELQASPAEVTAGPPVSDLLLQKSSQAFDPDGTFQAGLGDLDGDSDLDAVFANPLTHNSEVWLNDGDVQGGTPGQFTDTGQQLTTYGHGVGLADFNEDGNLDAFIACHQFVVPSRVYLNDGSGSFQDTGQDLGDRSMSANEVNLLDVDGDGHIDVHVLYYSPDGLPDRVYRNDGHAVFTDSGLALDEDTIVWGDLDNDGDVDYFGKRFGQGYVVQINDAGGRFTLGWQLEDGQVTEGGVALGDFDGDGDLDVLVTNGFRSTFTRPSQLFWNDGTGQFVDSGQLLNETLASDVSVGDLDGDGDLDVVVANMDLPNEVWLNDGSGYLTDSGLRLGKPSPRGHSTTPSLGDLDGDGDLDLIIGDLVGAPEVWFNLAR